MSPQISVPTSEQPSSSGLPTGTGPAFVAGLFDQGPPVGNTTGYVQCNGLSDVIAAFGPRSATNATAWDWLDEFFNEGGTQGKTAFVTRVSDGTAVSATLTLMDGAASPAATVLVTAGSPGTEANYISVATTAASGKTFTGNTASSVTVSNVTVSAFNNIGIGTPISGAGIPANCYISAVNAAARTLTLSAAATATTVGVTLTPGTATVTVTQNDSLGNQVASEVHGPFYTPAALIASASALVVLTPAPSTSNKLPAVLASTPLTGGVDPTDITDASSVSALAVFNPLLGPGSVALPGLTSATAWAGIQAHCNANNRWGILDTADNTSSATIAATIAGALSGDTSRVLIIQGSATIPPSTSGVVRTVAGSAVVAAQRAIVARGNNQAVVPGGLDYPLTYATGFTTFYGQSGCFQQADVNALEAVGVNVFAEIAGVNCLWGFVSPFTTDKVYDQANAATARMDVVAATQAVLIKYPMRLVNLADIEQLQTELNGMMLPKYTAGQFYDGGSGAPGDAFTVTTAAPVNTPATAQAKQLNAKIECRFPRYADQVTAPVSTIPVSISL